MDARKICSDFVAAGGKRLRPRLLKAVFNSLKSGEDPRVESLAEAIELMHKATLVHDDIQDYDTERYGKPTVWREYGVGVAIAVGDLLLAQAFRMIATSGFDNVGDMLNELSSAMLELCSGQADELTGISDYVTIARRKTGSLFALAAALGALAAKADPAPYREWGETYGILFQIRDDIADGLNRPGLKDLEKKYELMIKTMEIRL